MRSAYDDLAEIEGTTDWPALIEMALADPPRPGELQCRFQQWANVFAAAYRGDPLFADYPEPMQMFFRRLTLADFPPELVAWIDAFKARRGRDPSPEEIPLRLRPLLPGSRRRGGRPRLDTKRWRDARAAWITESYRTSYELRRDTIRAFRRLDQFSALFGFPPESVNEDGPSALALEKLSEEVKLSPSRLGDLLGHRTPRT
jgi:hypothetical protein